MAVGYSDEQVDRAIRLLAHLPGEAQRAMARGINRALEGARASAAKQIRRTYRISARAVKKTISLRRATRSQLSAEVKSVAPRVPLFAFGPRPSEPGTGGKGKPVLRVGVRRKGGRKRLAGAFVVRRGGKLHVARRKGSTRFPLETLYGPAVPQMMGVESVTREVEKVATERLADRLEHEINRALQKAAR